MSIPRRLAEELGLVPMSEATFTAKVVACARENGWLVHHSRPAVNRRGKWSTPLQGHRGMPDILAVRGSTILAAELKVGPNKLTPEQRQWLDALERAGALTRLWRPEEWSEIEEVLKDWP